MISFAFWRQPNGLWMKNCARSGPAVEKPGTYWPYRQSMEVERLAAA
jgi:hypothetical protein